MHLFSAAERTSEEPTTSGYRSIQDWQEKSSLLPDSPSNSKSEPPLPEAETSPSTKSESNSSPRKDRPRKKFAGTNKILKRGAGYREIRQDDLKWLWVAYNYETFDHNDIPPGLSRDDFTRLISQLLGASTQSFVLEAWTERGYVPVGLVVTMHNGWRMAPTFQWFRSPYVSKRNILETAIAFFNGVRKTHVAFMHIKDEDERFLRHISKYGVIRCIGRKFDYFRRDEHAWAFQTRYVN